MRYDTPVYFQKIIPGEYDKTTGDYADDTVEEVEKYENIVINCMRYLGIDDLDVIDRMTIPEFRLRMKAYQLKQLDKECDMFAQAWINRQSGAKKRSGKPFYRSFKQFFDINKFKEKEKEILNQEIKPEVVKKNRLVEAMRKAERKYGKL